MNAKRFALLSFGVLCIMLSALIGFHLGGSTAEAQAPGGVVGYSGNLVLLDNGDVWQQFFEQIQVNDCAGSGSVTEFTICRPPLYVGNFWTGSGTVGTSPSTMGGVKELFK